MAWFLVSAFLYFPQERDGSGAEEAVLLSCCLCRGCAGGLQITELRNWFLCICALSGALAVQQVYGGMGIRARRQSSLLCQLRNVLSWEGPGSPTMLHQVFLCPNGDGAAAGLCQVKVVPCLGRAALFACIFMKMEVNSNKKWEHTYKYVCSLHFSLLKLCL